MSDQFVELLQHEAANAGHTQSELLGAFSPPAKYERDVIDDILEYMNSRPLEDLVKYLDTHPVSTWYTMPTGAIIHRFYMNEAFANESYTDDDLIPIALALRNVFGCIAVESAASYCSSKFVTILDDIVQHHKYEDASNDSSCVNKYNNICERFEKVMKQVGFMYASEIDYVDLMHEYVCQMRDQPYQDMPITYPYQSMRDKRAPLAEALAVYLYNPDRIAKWLKANPGKEIEEYMT